MNKDHCDDRRKDRKFARITFIHKYFTTFSMYTDARSYGKLYRYTY